MTRCDEIRTELGGYALGALEPEEARRVAAHLEVCKRCRSELEQLSLASDLLRTPEARALAAEAETHPPSAEQALAGVAAARSAELRRSRRLRAGALGTGAGFLTAVAIAVALGTRPTDSFAPTGAATALRAAPGVAATASVRLSPRPWGTQVDLRAERMPRLPQGSYYEVWLVRADGTRVAAGTFRPNSLDGRARVRLAAAVPLVQVARVGVTREGAGRSARVLGAPA